MSWFGDFEGVRPREHLESLERQSIEQFELSPGEQEYLRQIEGLSETRWPELSITERAAALRELEARLAEIEGRPAIQIQIATLEPGINGYYDRSKETMVVSASLLGSVKPQEAIDTVAHEGRHAYQHYAIEHQGIHDDPLEVAAWRENFADYLSASMFGYEAYRNQPVEADAWRYGGMVRGIFEQPNIG